jgi:hypothetical protein
MACTIGAMEQIGLLLGTHACRSSVSVMYLPTDLPALRSKAVLPVQDIDKDDENPYYPDAMEKYFARPNTEELNNLTYPDYFRMFEVSKKKAKSNHVGQDGLGYSVNRRSQPLVIRYQYMRVEDTERFFYQQLLLQIPVRSEDELLGGHLTYREHYRERFRDLYDVALDRAGHLSQVVIDNIQNAYEMVVVNVVSSIRDCFGNEALTEHVRSQLSSLHRQARGIRRSDIIIMPEDQ